MNEPHPLFSWVIPKGKGPDIDMDAWTNLQRTLERDLHLKATLREYPDGGWYGDVVLDAPCAIIEFDLAYEDLRREIEPMVRGILSSPAEIPAEISSLAAAVRGDVKAS